MREKPSVTSTKATPGGSRAVGLRGAARLALDGHELLRRASMGSQSDASASPPAKWRTMTPKRPWSTGERAARDRCAPRARSACRGACRSRARRRRSPGTARRRRASTSRRSRGRRNPCGTRWCRAPRRARRAPRRSSRGRRRARPWWRARSADRPVARVLVVVVVIDPHAQPLAEALDERQRDRVEAAALPPTPANAMSSTPTRPESVSAFGSLRGVPKARCGMDRQRSSSRTSTLEGSGPCHAFLTRSRLRLGSACARRAWVVSATPRHNRPRQGEVFVPCAFRGRTVMPLRHDHHGRRRTPDCALQRRGDGLVVAGLSTAKPARARIETGTGQGGFRAARLRGGSEAPDCDLRGRAGGRGACLHRCPAFGQCRRRDARQGPDRKEGDDAAQPELHDLHDLFPAHPRNAGAAGLVAGGPRAWFRSA